MITTSRLLLRPMRRDDGAHLIRFYGCAEVMAIRKFGVMDRTQTLAGLETILEHWRRHGFGLWAVTEPKEGTFMGECGLRWLEDGSDVELSYGLFPAFRERGYATEAAAATIRYGFQALSLPRIVALSRGDNTTSHRVLEKCGMRLVKRWARPPAGLVKYVIERR